MEEYNFSLEDSMMMLARTYHKILKINLTTDTHIVVKTYESERKKELGYSEKSSQWFRDFALSGQIYEKDVPQYLKFTDIDNLRTHFWESPDPLRIRYRRRTHGVFRWAMMEFLQASDYSEEEQWVMLYIQDIHDHYAKELEEQRELEYYCNYDTLTGLSNFYAYRTACTAFAASMKKRGLGVLFADLNGLKIVNDTRGHEKGNEYICSFSSALRKHFPQQDCYRISGDEFLMVSVGETEEEFIRNVEEFDRIIKQKAVPVAALGWCWSIADDIEPVTAEAETGMYVDKHKFYEAHPEYKRSAVGQNLQNEMSALVRVLMDSYEKLIVIDLEMDTYRVIKQRQTSINANEEEEEGVYSKRNSWFCGNYVSGEFRELRESFGNVHNLRRMLKEEEHIICDYRLKNGQWRESSFWRMESRSGEPVRVIYCSQEIDHAMVERLSHRREVESEFDIIAGLRDAYSSISVIDINTERIRLHKNNTLPDSVSEILRDSDYEQMRQEFAKKYIMEADRERFLEETKLVTIRMKLRKNQVLNLLYRTTPAMGGVDKETYSKFVFCFPMQETDKVVMATKDITAIVEWSRQ